jgi:hypothetical protein
MTIIKTFHKNSNTGQLIKRTSFEDTHMIISDNFYDFNGKSIENPSLKGFVEISEKKFDREAKKQNKTIK